MSYRNNVSLDNTPIQQSMTMDPADYRGMNVNKLMLGVVLSVGTADSQLNRSSTQSVDRRGFAHEATVLIINGGAADYMLLKNVIITPDLCSGLNNYVEQLPRPSTVTVDGTRDAAVDSSLHHIDPYELDGDWCVVGFIGSTLNQPFILRWWPHAQNAYDPLTSGLGNPDGAGSGTALDQSGRFFRRVNGVEQVVTTDGDVYLSTHYSGSTPNPGGSPTLGRFPRSERAGVGGSIKLNVKPTQSLELDWNAQQNGLGIRGRPEPQLPQANPVVTIGNEDSKASTYFRIEQDRVHLATADQFDVISSANLAFTSADLTETISNAITITAASQNTTTSGAITFVSSENFNVSCVSMTLLGSTGIDLAAPSITLTSGGGGGEPVALATGAWVGAMSGASNAVALVAAAVTTPAKIGVLASLVAAIGAASSPSSTVKVD